MMEGNMLGCEVHFSADEFCREKARGYLAGWEASGLQFLTSVEHRSASYRHGCSNGRDDRLGKQRFSAELDYMLADAALASDMARTAT
ncbi:hypothetical protein [Labrys sp. 22185]|uniref:hypothetical protein n=1 Tax=Labrys sp. 22185 TaxID=3453888 RepID=UPI003F83C145